VGKRRRERVEGRYFMFLDDSILKTLITYIELDIVCASAMNCNFIDHKSDA